MGSGVEMGVVLISSIQSDIACAHPTLENRKILNAGARILMDHPIRTLLYEIAILPILQFIRRIRALFG